MRILHVLNHTKQSNGHVHAAIDLACAQVAMGHSVAVASRSGDFTALLTRLAIEEIFLDQSRDIRTLAKAEQSLMKIVRRFDIVHAHMMTSAVLCWPVCRILRRPLITTVHNEFERSAVLMGLGSRVIAVSSAVSCSMARRGIPKSKLRTVLNGTIGNSRLDGDIDPLTLLGSPSILYVGGLHPRKGLPDLLIAFDIVAKSFPFVHLHIVGEGPRQDCYKKIASSLESSNSISFHGAMVDPRPYFCACDIFVLPSLAEPAGLVLSEACEAGCAIIATNVGGIPEMLDDGKAGLLTPPGDPAKLADSIIGLIRNPAALATAKALSKANTSRLEIERVASQTLAIYNECLGV